MALQVWLPLNGNLNSSGAVNVTVINNGATVTNNDKGGQCYNFASGNYMGIDANNVNNHKYSPISVALWMYITTSDTTERPAVCCWESGGVGVSAQNGQIVFSAYISGAYRYCYSASITSNAWHHVCCVYNGTIMSIYIDGKLSGTQTQIAGTITYHATCPWEIGGNPAPSAWGAGTFIGRLYDLRIYNHALTHAEIEVVAGTATTKRVTYKGKKIDDAVMTDFYNRLNTLRTAGGAAALTVPSLAGIQVTAAQVKTDLFNAITTTKSGVSFLSGLTLPYAQPDATVGSLIRAGVFQNAAGTTVARAEKNIGTMEAACRNFCSTNVSGWSVNHSAKTVGSWGTNHSAKTVGSWNNHHSGKTFGGWGGNHYFQGFSGHGGSWYGNCTGHAGYPDGNPCYCGASGNCSSNGRWAIWSVNHYAKSVGSWSVNCASTAASWSVNCSKNTISGWSNNALTFSANNTTFTVEGLDFN